MSDFLKDHRVLYAYFISAFIFTVAVYALLFEAVQADRDGCEKRNVTRVELNERGHTTRNILTTLIKARIGPDALARLDKQSNVNIKKIQKFRKDRARIDHFPILSCESEYPLPWPFRGL